MFPKSGCRFVGIGPLSPPAARVQPRSTNSFHQPAEDFHDEDTAHPEALGCQNQFREDEQDMLLVILDIMRLKEFGSFSIYSRLLRSNITMYCKVSHGEVDVGLRVGFTMPVDKRTSSHSFKPVLSRGELEMKLFSCKRDSEMVRACCHADCI